VAGAEEVVSEGGDVAALVDARARARRRGPLVTWAPSLPPGLSL
jgi:hypothetical protein